MTFDAAGRVRLDNVSMADADYSDRWIIQLTVVGSHLTSARFDRAHIRYASFGAGQAVSTYTNCSFDGSTIEFGPAGYARFVRCSFRDARLSGWHCETVEMIDCHFGGVLESSFFNGTVPDRSRQLLGRRHNEFRDNDFSNAKLVDVGFRTGIDLRRQRLPTGPEYVTVHPSKDGFAGARKVVAGWDDPQLRQRGLGCIAALQLEANGGQQELFVQLHGYDELDRVALTRVTELLGA